MIRSRRLLPVAVAACAGPLVLPVAAHAAGLSITNDAGAVVAATPGLTLRNMSPELTPTFTTAELNQTRTTRYTLTVDGPGGPAITPVSCSSAQFATAERIKYTTNGTYTATLNAYPPPPGTATNTCQTTPQTTVVPIVIGASAAIAAPAQGKTLLTRQPGSFSALAYQFPLDINPGSSTTEVTYARGAVLTNGTGPISGAPLRDGPDSGVTFSTITVYDPGDYTFLAQATSLYGASPYSAPLKVRFQDPFDVVGEPFFADSRGPRYAITASVRSKVATGKILLDLKRRGAKKYRRAGAGRIRADRQARIRFTQGRTGRYTVRLRYKGSRLVRRGSVAFRVRFTRRTTSF